MKTLVIHPKDSTTDFLSDIYSDKDWTIITTNISKKLLKDSIKSHDRIVMLGHGTELGLLGFDRFIIDSSLVYLLRDKVGVFIWCNADVFVKKYKLKGFFTGMFISEFEEALNFCITTNYFFLTESNKDFANAVKLSIDTNDILTNVLEHYDGNSAVVDFNKERMFEIKL
jgi:hypothetical protein